MSWTPVEAALVTAIAHHHVECELRPRFGMGSDCSDLMTTLLEEIQGLCAGTIDPDEFMTTKGEHA